MAEFTVGQASILLVPSFKGFAEAIDAESARWGDSSGATFADTFSARAAEGTKNAIGDQDADAADKGDSAGGKFADTFSARVAAAVKALPDAKINADSSEVDRKIQEIRLELDELGKKNIGVDLSDDEALAKLAVLKAALVEIGRSSESVSVKVNTGAALGQIAAVEGAAGGGSGLETLAADAENAGTSISSFLIPALAVLSTTLIPIGGLALGALAALPAILAGTATGGAAVLLGFSGIPSALTAYNATLNTAGLTAAQVATKHRDLVNALAGLSPAGQQFVQFVGSQLLPTFKNLESAVQSALLPGITSGLQAMLPFFQAVQPFIVGAAKGIGQTFTELGQLIGSGPGLKDITTILKDGNDFMSKLGGAFVTGFGAVLKIGGQASPIVRTIADGIKSMVDDFAKWVSNGGFEKFLTWLRDNGPGIVNTIEGLAKGIGQIIVGLAPVGVALLGFIGFITKVIAVIVDVIHWMGEWALLLVPMIAPIILIGQYWNTAWSFMRDTAIAVWNAIYNNVIKPLTDIFNATFPGTLHAFEAIWDAVWGGVGAVVSAAWSVISVIVAAISFGIGGVQTAIDDLAYAWGAVWGGLAAVVQAAYNAVKPIIDLVKTAVNDVKDALNFLSGSGSSSNKPGSPGTTTPPIPHALGGPVFPGVDYLIGERGPEILRLGGAIPYVIPNSQLASPTFAGYSGGSSGPVQHNDQLIINHPSDAVALGQQLAFLRRAAVL